MFLLTHRSRGVRPLALGAVMLAFSFNSILAAAQTVPQRRDSTVADTSARKATTRGTRTNPAAAMPGMPGMQGMSSTPVSPTPKRVHDGVHDNATSKPAVTIDTMPMTRSDTSMMAMHPNPLGVSMDRMGSGTTWVPEAAPLPSRHFFLGGWDLMAHGFIYGQYNKQGGDRGGSQLGSLNWGMLMASHELLGGRFQARTMLSLDAAGVTPKGYPLLLQSGESYNGAPLHDRQHPHDLFMELGALYERPVTHSVGVSVYAAPSGEPALGPVAFMHRPSAMDNPLAPISHHWQDATHISFGVLTAGIFTHDLKIEGSYFNSREPDQFRYDFDPIKLDSYSGRVTFDPTAKWSFTAGYGYLNSPEALNPDMSMHRFTASALHGTSFGTDGQWATSLIYGANKHSTSPGWSNSVLAESETIFDRKNTLFGRAEFVQKSADELVLDGTAGGPPPPSCGGICTTGSSESSTASSTGFSATQSFNVGEVSLGYIREVTRVYGATIGLGAEGTVNMVPSTLQSAYGSRTPLGMVLFLRLRPFFTHDAGATMKDMKGMKGMSK